MSMPKNVAELIRVGSLELIANIAKERNIVCKMYWSEPRTIRVRWGARVPIGQEVLGGLPVTGPTIPVALKLADWALQAHAPEYGELPKLTAYLMAHPDCNVRTIKNKYYSSDHNTFSRSANTSPNPIVTALNSGGRMLLRAEGSELNDMLQELEQNRYLG